jgi:hypothetical protein
LRIGPRQTISGLRSSQEKERTHSDEDLLNLRFRWIRGIMLVIVGLWHGLFISNLE